VPTLPLARPRSVSAARPARPIAWYAAPFAGLLSVAAGYIHVLYVPSHWQDWWAYGAFFLATGIFQTIYAVVVVRWPTAMVAMAGIVSNLAIVGMYFWSRTIGIPMGPHVHVKERVGTVDLATTAAEIVLVGALLLLVTPRERRWLVNALLLVGVALWAARFTGVIR